MRDRAAENSFTASPESALRPRELGPAQSSQHDNWAVGFYNARGGYTLGQVWKNPAHPDPRKAVFSVTDRELQTPLQHGATDPGALSRGIARVGGRHQSRERHQTTPEIAFCCSSMSL
jgi:hypothetical protein